MGDLFFDETDYTVKTCVIEQEEITFRAYEKLPYCVAPAAEVQILNLYVPAVFYQGEEINGYGLHTAPIFMPNTVGGYMEGPADEPGRDMGGRPNSVFRALKHGYVVACAGIRGRTTGRSNTEFFEGSTARSSEQETGRMVGKAPALIVDMKAAIRYLRFNRDRIPGDTEHIITNGTSAGGALSALAGATGNSADYEPYLQAIGAAEERDDIFAASCYCPIHNLENADAAYEWLFCGCNTFHSMMFQKTEKGIAFVPVTGDLTEKQIQMSAELKQLFPDYVNGLHLKDMRNSDVSEKVSTADTNEKDLTINTNGKELTLDTSGKELTLDTSGKELTLEADGTELMLETDGTGSFLEYVKSYVMQSAQKELDDHKTEETLPWLQVEGSRIAQQDYLKVENGKVVDMDWDAFVKKITRMKATPAFDAVDLNSPENEEFGTEDVERKHFTAYSAAHSEVGGMLADEAIIHMMNPVNYIGGPGTTAHWRIRHGAFDRDTSLAIPVILATLLMNHGYDVDFCLPWGLPHSGDYDLDELFAWIDGLCR